MPHLVRLDLSYNVIGDAGVQHLTSAWSDGAMPHLVRLDLSYNVIGDAGCVALTGSSGLGALEALALWRNQIGDAGVHALGRGLAARRLPSLQRLHLDYNRFSHSAAEAVVAHAKARVPEVKVQLSLQ